MLMHQIKKQSSPESQCSPLRPLPVITPSQGTSSISFIKMLFIYLLEWIAISFSRGSSQPRDRTRVSRIPGRCFNLWATREALIYLGLHWIFTAASGLLPRCSEQGLLCSCGAQAPGSQASVVSVLGLKSTGSTVAEHRLSCSESCGIVSDRAHISCIGRQILYHWATREAISWVLVPGFFLPLLCFM